MLNAIEAIPTIQSSGPRIGVIASMPVGFDGSTPSVMSTFPARSIDPTIPTANRTTSVRGSHRHRGDATAPVGNSARNNATGATAAMKIQLLSQTATWPNGSAPGDV